MNNNLEVVQANNIKIDNKINTFYNPDNIYIPLYKGMKLNKDKDLNVLKNELLLKGSDFNIYSPISGVIKKIDDDIYINNKPIKAIVIENDFKEEVKKKKYATKYIDDLEPSKVLELMNKYNILDIPLNPIAKTLVISGIEVDPFERNNTFIINNYSAKILETIDALINIFHFEKTYFCITNNNSEVVYNLTSNIGTYPNIKLKVLDNSYPLGLESVLVSKLLTKKELKWKYNYLTCEDLLNIYRILKKDNPISEKLITVGGNCIDESKVIAVKYGTKISDIIKNNIEITNDKYLVVENGLIAGKVLSELNNIVTRNTRSIFLNTKDTRKEKKCINCGLCMFKCPVGLNPKLIKDGKGDKSKCIHCGACTYVCPSLINFKKYLGDKDE
ncbi:MAG: 4Fe-4S binding protein [Bacilli bacterium]|nr:4Fe-4S binding protein [Bacilli bacterium]